MPKLYPLLLTPVFSHRPWGARDLAPIYDMHVHPGEESIGEAWLTGEDCVVRNGPLSGSKLGDLCSVYGRELVGEVAPQEDFFPLLIKFLFPRDKLSVQVHPDDLAAKLLNQPCGKTECWYVLDAEPGAQIGLGLKPGTTKAEFERAIRETRAEHLMNWINVHPGEMYYVEAGTVHAIGPGSILVETQQYSDTTYRLYDYGRPRELHVREGLEALKVTTGAGVVEPIEGEDYERLVASSSFVVDRFALTAEQEFKCDGKSAICLTAIGGCGVVEAEGTEPVTFARGDGIVVPAAVESFTIRPQWTIEFLRSSVPSEKVSAPRTTMPVAQQSETTTA